MKGRDENESESESEIPGDMLSPLPVEEGGPHFLRMNTPVHFRFLILFPPPQNIRSNTLTLALELLLVPVIGPLTTCAYSFAENLPPFFLPIRLHQFDHGEIDVKV